MATADTPTSSTMASSERQTKERLIFIAIDGSETSLEAFQIPLDLCAAYMNLLKQDSDKVTLLFCKELSEVLNSFWKETVYNYDPELLRGKLSKEQAEAKVILEPLVEKLTQCGVKNKPMIVVAKDPGHVIVEMAEREKAQLIIMGSRGHSKLRRTMLGSCTDYVANHAHIPVVICKHSKTAN